MVFVLKRVLFVVAAVFVLCDGLPVKKPFESCHSDYTPPDQFGMYRENRARVLDVLRPLAGPQEAFMIIGALQEYRPYADTEFDVRNDSPFLWLSGWNRPHSVLVTGVNTGQTILFLRRKTRVEAIFDGDWDVAAIVEEQDVDLVYFTDEIDTILNSVFPGITLLHIYDESRLREQYPELLGQYVIMEDRFRDAVRDMRMIKSDRELEFLRVASFLAANTHIEVMKHMHPGWTEAEVSALFQYESYNCDERFQAYIPICGAGVHSATLHYVANDDVIEDGDVFLIDASGEYYGYASDLTRTYPANGKFTPEQTIVYNIVKDAQQAAIDEVRDGALNADLNTASRNTILNGLAAAGFVNGTLQELIDANVIGIFMPHGLGHGVGYDVHDDTTLTVLRSGMVFTIEPGVYFIGLLIEEARNGPNSHIYNFEMIDAYAEFGGVRIEDVIIVTDTGSEVITAGVPREIEEIEILMNSEKQEVKSMKHDDMVSLVRAGYLNNNKVMSIV